MADSDRNVQSDRDRRADALLARGLRQAPEIAQGRWLLVGSLPESHQALRERGEIASWVRFATEGRDPRPAPPAGPYVGAVVRAARGSEARRMVLHLASAQLAPEASLWTAACNDEGGRSLGTALAEIFGEVDEPEHGGHARRWSGRAPDRANLRGDLDDWRSTVSIPVGGEVLSMVSWPGLFAHGRLDPGTALLAEHLPDPRGARTLDLAAGAGLLGRLLSLRGAASVDLSDHDALAIHAASINVADARVHCVDGVPPAPEGGWDLVVSNPPIHRGQDRDLSMIGALADTLPAHLSPRGELWLVAQATVPIRSLLGGAFGSTEPVATDRSFTVWRLVRRQGAL